LKVLAAKAEFEPTNPSRTSKIIQSIDIGSLRYEERYEERIVKVNGHVFALQNHFLTRGSTASIEYSTIGPYEGGPASISMELQSSQVDSAIFRQ
jgi:hypothetical protein